MIRPRLALRLLDFLADDLKDRSRELERLREAMDVIPPGQTRALAVRYRELAKEFKEIANGLVGVAQTLERGYKDRQSSHHRQPS